MVVFSSDSRVNDAHASVAGLAVTARPSVSRLSKARCLSEGDMLAFIDSKKKTGLFL